MAARTEYPLTPVERVNRRRRLIGWVVVVALVAAALWYFVFSSQYVIAHEGEVDHFKYGSIGSEVESGLPYWVFQALPVLYKERLGGRGYRHFGFLYEDGAELPVGVSRRVVTGIERVWLNCAVCHVGTVRPAGGGERRYIYGGSSNNLRLYDFIGFLLDVGRDPGFNADMVIAAIESEEVGGDLNILEELLYRTIIVPRVKAGLIRLNGQLGFVYRQHDWGPGRVDTFNPYKAVQFNFPMDPEHISEQALNGPSDYPSVWRQRPREGMNLHWDGNNSSVSERNLSAALGAGVTPTTVDIASIERVAAWMWDLPAPRFPAPETIDRDKARRGAEIFAGLCAGCHGFQPLAQSQDQGEPAAPQGSYQAGSYGGGYDRGDGYDYDTARHRGLGRVVPLSEIGTDPGRWASYTENFAAAQNMLYAGYDWRFRNFRKTAGYASHPLDGIWARSPYLHNGSVPTLRDLLEPAERRPKTWFRGSDAFDFEKVGYRSDPDPAASLTGRVFRYDTTLPGNSNAGHEGSAYGTTLADEDKDALVEYMKTL